jgi:post-segregation antitoxin (ccd killing protein)
MKANLSLDAEINDQALNSSGESAKKAGVTLALRESIALRWSGENRESIAAFNKEIEERDVWSEGIRSW